MIRPDIKLKCDIAWQEKFLELTGLKIGDVVDCNFSASHGNARQSFSYLAEGKGTIVMTEKGIFVKSHEKYKVARSEKSRRSRAYIWLYHDEFVFSRLENIIIKEG